MTPLEELEKIKLFVSCNHPQESIYLCETDEYKRIKESLKALDIYKELFPITLVEIQGQKYISVPADDIRRNDILFRISDEKYNILKEVLG